MSTGRPSRTGTRRMAGVLVVLLAATGCGADSAGAASAGAAPGGGSAGSRTSAASSSAPTASATPGAQTATAPDAAPGLPTVFATDPVRVDSGQSGQLVAVTAWTGGGVDRLVFQFAGTAPGFTVQQVTRVTTGATNERDSDVVDVAGNGFLSVTFTSTTANTDGAISQDVATNADFDLPLLRQVVLVHNVGGRLRFGVGVGVAEPQFRVVTDGNPTRVVVELKAP